METKRINVKVGLVLAIMLASAGSLQAAVLDLTIEAAAGEWQVYGLLDGDTDNDGIASIVLDVVGLDGVAVTGSQRELPRFYDTSFNQTGFVHTFSSDGTDGTGIAQLQVTVNTPVGVRILTGIGSVGGSEMAPFAPPGFPPAGMQTWGAPVLLASGTYDDTGAGAGAGLAVDLAPTTQLNVLIEGYTQGQTQGVREADGVLPGQVLLGGDPPTNTAPTAEAGGDYGEYEWTGPTGWNNPGRMLALDGNSNDPDGDPLTHAWFIAPPGTTDFELLTGIDGDTPTISIQDVIDALGAGALPAETSHTHHGQGGGGHDDYLFVLKHEVSDGDLSGEGTALVFVPEPGTLALLAFGGIGALIRRRRRA